MKRGGEPPEVPAQRIRQHVFSPAVTSLALTLTSSLNFPRQSHLLTSLLQSIRLLSQAHFDLAARLAQLRRVSATRTVCLTHC